MCSSSPPPAPDYKGAAEATAAGNLEAAQAVTQANRPNEYTPFGQKIWTNLGQEQFDQPAYDTAMQKYQADLATYEANKAGNPLLTAPTAPTKEQFTNMVDENKWQSETTFSPEVQSVIDQILAAKGGLAGLSSTAVTQAGEALSQPLNLPSNMPTYEGPGTGIPQFQGPEGQVKGFEPAKQEVMDRMLSRVTSDIQREKQSTHDKLVAQGIPPGSEAYNRQMEQINRKEVDARQQAELAASQMAGQEYQNYLRGRGAQNVEDQNRFVNQMQQYGLSRQEAMDLYNTGTEGYRQKISDALLRRQTPLNELTAILSGSQVQTPTFGAGGSMPFTGGPDYLGAAQGQSAFDLGGYNAQQAQQNAIMSGLFTLGAAAI